MEEELLDGWYLDFDFLARVHCDSEPQPSGVPKTGYLETTICLVP